MNKTITPNITYQPFINEDGMEEVRYIDPEFPLELWTADFENLAHNQLEEHWHDAFEFALVIHGKAVYEFGTQNVNLSPGEALFVNSAVPHRTAPIDQDLTLFTVAFPPIIFGFPGAVLYDDATSLLRNSDIGAVILSDPAVIDKLHGLYEYAKSPALSFLHLTVAAFELWELFLDAIDTERVQIIKKMQDREEAQLKYCIAFVRRHWQEKITVEDLAKSASISKNTCYRLFRRYTHVTPTAFINRFRINKAELLLLNTTRSIQDIAFSCGFNSVVYFDRLFHRFHGMTPREYRNASKGNKQSTQCV